jgi:hypothetical protein
MIPWHIIVLVLVPFLGALVWPSKKARQKKISKEQPSLGPVLEQMPFSSYEQGYQGQTPAQSAKHFPFIRRNVAEPKRDSPGTLYEQPQAHSSERDLLLP